MKTDMKKNKSIRTKLLFATIFISSILFYTPAVNASTVIKDIDISYDYAKQSILNLASKNIISGDENGNFNPLSTITRGEMVKMIVNAQNIDTSNIPDIPAFNDVPKEHWAYKYVEAAAQAGIVQGISPDIFGVNQECTREEMAAMFVRSIGLSEEDMIGQQPYIYFNSLKDKDTVSSWAKEYVEFTLSTNLMQGIDTDIYGGKEPAQRQQVAVLTDRFISNGDSLQEFSKTFSGEMSYPELYNTMIESNTQFKGNMDFNMEMNLTDPNNSKMNITENMTGPMDMDTNTDLLDFDMNYTISLIVDSTPFLQERFQLKKINNTAYLKYFDTNTWQSLPLEQMEEFDPTSISSTSSLLNYYRYASISKEENVDFKGTSTTKYTFSFHDKVMESLTSILLDGEQATELTGGEGTLTDLSSSSIEIYLNDQNQLIYEVYMITGTMWDEDLGGQIDFDVLVNSYYSNIGEDVNIEVPKDIE